MEATSDYDHPRDDRGLTPLARAVFPQVRVAPRVGAKSARLSTVKTYAREVGMKKDGTSATVRPPPLSSHVEECPLRESPPSDRRAVPRADPTSPRRDDRRIPNDPRDLTSRSASDPRLSAPLPRETRLLLRAGSPTPVRPGGRQALGVPGLRIHHDGSLGQWAEEKLPACGERRFALKTQAEMNIAIGSSGVVALLVAALYLLVKLA